MRRNSTSRITSLLGRDPLSNLAIGQGIYYFLTGVWPFLSMKSFLAVTGPKWDLWLVKIVGGLVGAIGLGLILAGWRRRVTPEIQTIAVGSAAFLAVADSVFVARKRIPPIYLADAAAEAALIAAWGAAWQASQDSKPVKGRQPVASGPTFAHA